MKPSAHRPMLRILLPLLLSAVGLASSQAMGGESPSPAVPESGVWQKHAYSFAFRGFTTTYSCDGLASTLKVLLLASGARQDVKSQPGACASGFGQPDRFARANVTFYTLAPVAAAPAGAGVPGTVIAPPPAAPTPVAGQWKQVTLAASRPRELGLGDCELVEQFETKLLPLFAVRNKNSHTNCIPHQESGSVIDLQFESFAAPARAGLARIH